jgi:OPT oligopeptide transporter protein
VAYIHRVPTAYVWIYTARLVTGQGLPTKVPEWALGAAVLFAFTTSLRIWLNASPVSRRQFAAWIPGGIAVAVGTYNAEHSSQTRLIQRRNVQHAIIHHCKSSWWHDKLVLVSTSETNRDASPCFSIWTDSGRGIVFNSQFGLGELKGSSFVIIRWLA